MGQEQRVCAIHQPNLFPRWRTLTKLLAADVWIVLDDVQFCRRDYQHRARLGDGLSPDHWQWLTLPVHLDDGRSTLIRDVRIAEQATAHRRVVGLTRQHYRRTRRWNRISGIVDNVATAVGETDNLATVAERSTTDMLRACGWVGRVLHASDLGRRSYIRTDRSARLVDLALAAGCTRYLCGRGGRRYLDTRPFVAAGIDVAPAPDCQDAAYPSGFENVSALAYLSH